MRPLERTTRFTSEMAVLLEYSIWAISAGRVQAWDPKDGGFVRAPPALSLFESLLLCWVHHSSPLTLHCSLRQTDGQTDTETDPGTLVPSLVSLTHPAAGKGGQILVLC